jgi:PhoPQ-activated pathogenicity-related protein
MAKKTKKAQNQKIPLKSTPHNTLNSSSPTYLDIIMFLLSTTRLAKSSTNFVHNLSPFSNELIKYKSREEQDALYEIKIRVLHKAYKQVFK